MIVCQLCGGGADVRVFDELAGGVAVCVPCVKTMHGTVHRDEVVARLAAGREAARSRGGWQAGTPPYGYRSVRGELRPVARELAVASWMVRQRSRGFSWQAIADALNDAGTPAPRSSKGWGVSTVRRIVERGGVYHQDARQSPDPVVLERARLAVAVGLKVPQLLALEERAEAGDLEAFAEIARLRAFAAEQSPAVDPVPDPGAVPSVQ